MKKLILFFALLALNACATRSVKVVDAQWISMRHGSAPEKTKQLSYAGPVNERYCMNSWSGSYGLMDEVVKQAESNQRLDYIKNASISKEVGRDCVALIGEGYRITQ